MSIVADLNLPIGTLLEIECAIPVQNKGLFTLHLKARVIYCAFSGAEQGFKLGLSFAGIPSESVSLIARYLA